MVFKINIRIKEDSQEFYSGHVVVIINPAYWADFVRIILAKIVIVAENLQVKPPPPQTW